MTVFANGLEISAKAQGCKVIADFPDTCFTPPQTPATPPGVPVPYPDFGEDSDLTSGSGSVKIGGKEISLENSSKYSKCTGDEAGAAPKKGIITSQNKGAVYAQKWSMDVKVEGKGVVRFSDMATSNHASDTGDAPPMVIIGRPGVVGLAEGIDCIVGEYEAIRKKCNAIGGEAHHIVPDKCFRVGTRAEAANPDLRIDNAPTLGSGASICLSGPAHTKIHQSEKTTLKALGRPDETGLSRRAVEAAKDAMKEAGTYGTADIDDIYEASEDMLDGLAPELTAECIKAGKEAIQKQQDDFDSGQVGRTSGRLPNAAAQERMIPPT